MYLLLKSMIVIIPSMGNKKQRPQNLCWYYFRWQCLDINTRLSKSSGLCGAELGPNVSKWEAKMKTTFQNTSASKRGKKRITKDEA